MKVVCTQGDLLGKLQIVSRAASQRPTLQILSGVLISAGSGIGLAATDMEMSIRVSVEGRIEEGGSVVVPARTLLDVVRSLPAGDVTLSQAAGAGTLTVAGGSSEFVLHTQAAEDFPQLPEPGGERFSVLGDAFSEIVGQVARAAGRDESRPVLTGIQLEFEPGVITMAATDSYRLAVKRAAVEGSTGAGAAIVPARALTELGRVAVDGDTIEVALSENQIVFSGGGAVLSARRIDGQFPDHRKLLPQAFEHEVRMGREEFLDVVRRTSVMAQRHIPLRLAFDRGELTVTAQTPDVGEARETIPVDWQQERLEIGFNAEFLRDGIESVPGADVRLRLISPLRPGMLQGADDSFSYLIMPIRLSS